MKLAKGIGTLASTLAGVLVLSLPATPLPIQRKATSHEKPDWQAKIVPGSQITVLDLARRIVPDIKSNLDNDQFKASDLSAVRLLDGVEETGMEIDLDSGEECDISAADYFWIKDVGAKLLVLLLKVDVERPIIGLFKVSPTVVLLDAVTIAQDTHVDVDTEKLWMIHSRRQAFAVQCWHDNSSESFDNYTFISIINRKLRAVAGPIVSTGFAAYLPARQRLCKTSMTPKFQFVRSPGGAYLDPIVTQTTLKVCHRESEEWSWKTGVVYQKSVQRVWRWNAKKRQYRRAWAPRR